MRIFFTFFTVPADKFIIFRIQNQEIIGLDRSDFFYFFSDIRLNVNFELHY